jgi:hypothetical protein
MMNIILKGITGSKAYGLDTPTSDTDIKGIFVAPTQDILGIFNVKETIDRTDPDECYHEVGKFIKLALKANPTVLELLYLDDYLEITSFGQMLIDNRHHFLSKTIYHSYGGYAISQARKLNARNNGIFNEDELHDQLAKLTIRPSFSSSTKNRYAKHARHCFRLLWQGRELLETGDLNVRLTPEKREELFAIGELPVDELVNKFETEFAEFDKIETKLPDKPNEEAINKILLKIRKGN